MLSPSLFYHEQLVPRASVWISDAVQHSQKRVWIYANKLYILNFFKNTEPNWFDLQLVRARFEFFLNLKTYRENSRMQFFFFARSSVLVDCSLELYSSCFGFNSEPRLHFAVFFACFTKSFSYCFAHIAHKCFP